MPRVKLIRPQVNHLAAVFAAYRKERHMTSVDVARMIGCTPQNARVQMSKPGKEWNVGMLMKYCDALCIPYEEAFREAVR